MHTPLGTDILMFHIILYYHMLRNNYILGMVIDNKLANPEIVYPVTEIDSRPQCRTIKHPLDVLLVIDSSGSLREKFQEEVNVARDIVNILPVEPDAARFALIQFSGYARTEFRFNDSFTKEQLLERLNAIRPIAGVTKTGNAIAHAIEELQQSAGHRGGEVPTIAYIISDGRTQDYPQDTIQAQRMRALGVDIWAYGTGEYVAIEELVSLTGDANKVVTSKNYQHLNELFTPYKTVEVCEEKKSVCIPGSDKPLDLLFVIDSSQSIDEKFREQVDFVRRAVSHVNVHEEAVRVAVITYAARPGLDFDFKKYDTKEKLLQGIDNLTSKNTTTRTDLALQLALQVFNGGKEMGVRNESVPKMAIVLTDGRSQRDPKDDAMKLSDRKILVFAVGIVEEERLDVNELLAIAGNNSNRVFTGNNLTQFEYEFKKYISMGCPGAKVNLAEPTVRGPVDVQCKENSIDISVRTQKEFGGKLYAMGYENDEKCTTNGRNDTRTSFTVPADVCGFHKVPLKGPPAGYLYKGSIVLQYHPMIQTKVDQSIPVECFIASDSILLKDSIQSSKELSCSYSLRQYDVENGCVVLDAKVGENLYHKWECNMSSQYGVLVHDCFAMADDQRTLQIVDEHGCQIDPYAFETPVYDKHNYVYRHFPIFKFPGSRMVTFKCQVSFCDKENGGCAGIVPPDCVGKSPLNRPKRASSIVKTMQVETRGVNVLENENIKRSDEFKYCKAVYI